MKKAKVHSASSTRSKSRAQKKTLSIHAPSVALSGTVTKGKPPKAELRLASWSSIPVEALNPFLGLHFVVGQNVMLARVLLKKGGIVPEHSHPNEQITFIMQGALKFTIEGKEIVVHAGEILTIPPHVPHRAEALEDTIDFDIFDPPRADWMNKTNAYLR